MTVVTVELSDLMLSQFGRESVRMVKMSRLAGYCICLVCTLANRNMLFSCRFNVVEPTAAPTVVTLQKRIQEGGGFKRLRLP